MKDYAKFTKKDNNSPIWKIIIGTIVSVPLRILEIPRICANLPKRDKWVLTMVMAFINLLLIFTVDDIIFRTFQIIIEIILIAYIAIIWNPEKTRKIDFEPTTKKDEPKFTPIEETVTVKKPKKEEAKTLTLADLTKNTYDEILEHSMNNTPDNMQDFATMMGGIG